MLSDENIDREDVRSGNVWPNDEDDYVPSDLEFLLAASLIDQGILQEAILNAIEGAVIADPMADPALGLTHFERHQLATRRRFGARGR